MYRAIIAVMVYGVLLGAPLTARATNPQCLATDPAAVRDFTAFSAATGNKLVEHSESGGVYRFVLQRSS